MTTLLHEFLDTAAECHPDRPAVRHGGTELTYRSLTAHSERIAAWLASVGVRRQDRVIVALSVDVLVPAVLYACSRVGAVFAVLREDTPSVVAAHVLDDAEPVVVLTDSSTFTELAAQRGIACHGLDTVRTADTGHPLAGGPIPVDPVCFIYTSGTTAMPKAVVSTHQQVTFAAQAIQSQLEYRVGDVVYCALPLSFDYGLYQVFLSTVAGSLLHLAVTGGHRLGIDLRDTGATILPAVPPLAANLAKLLSRRPQPLPRLRLLTNTGAAMPADVLGVLREHLPGLRVQLMYGLTECKRATIMPKDEDVNRPGACGRALPGTEVFVVDADGTRLAAGEIGEVVVRGPNVMAGYWRRPELTARRFPRADGLFAQLRTGDYGWLDADGYLYFAGRRDDLYKERGFRVSTIEVEAAAYRIPGVEAAVVLPPADGRDGATLLAQGKLSADAVLRALRDHLDEVKVPARCVMVPEIPVNANGKVVRAALAGLAGEG
ncbi:class I adenylate-forming enzyme family protein [Kibdelosporangium persicum]|uniref:AMP-dependent synthetase and ligase n=1 Tax=Kibdelosporangium persicum TaxID=2698649 RepID=A0ABX2FDQ9_9PSEU|nr:AMP-binding protein [Kibdelosporangium persicum]NRN69412.1 AMP-dependent synthetase and ligase [Kibdelosporangium persicum]